MSNFINFLKDTKSELKHVVWPSKNQTFYYTIIVIVLSFVVAYLLGLFDFGFNKGLDYLISL